MGIFRKLFGGKSENEEEELPRAPRFNRSGASIQELLEKHGALSFEKQLLLGELIGDRSWQLDMGGNSLRFGDDLAFPIQTIGSLAFNNQSWMWAWANKQSGIPQDLLTHSYELRQLGMDREISELTEPFYEVEENYEHKIGLIACGFFQAKSYYCANYGQGTLVLTLEGEAIPSIPLRNPEKVLLTFPQFISNFEVSHRKALHNYLLQRRFEVYSEGSTLIGTFMAKKIQASFDDEGRLINLEGSF